MAVAAITALLYAGFILLVRNGLKRLRSSPRAATQASISVVIPLRNEVGNVPHILNSLAALRYSQDKWEAILINDHSDDGTLALLKSSVINCDLPFVILDLPDTLQGKKAALNTGIAHSKYDIIAQTDADTTLHPDWLSSVSDAFSNASIRAAFGSVEVDNDAHLFSLEGLSALEFKMNMAMNTGVLGLGHILSCSGANFAYRKTARIEVIPTVKGENMATGDDHFVLRAIADKYGTTAIAYIANTVHTSLPNTHMDLIRQKKRWSSKIYRFGTPQEVAIAVLVAHTHIYLVFALIAEPAGFIILFTAICISDMALLARYARTTQTKPVQPPAYILRRLYYAFYSIALIPFVLLTTGEWKGRKL
jgi:cellulose synthase/poly-beta-1,6-N-acetylglucosamine synthase-like glycosyltransferase